MLVSDGIFGDFRLLISRAVGSALMRMLHVMNVAPWHSFNCCWFALPHVVGVVMLNVS